MFHDGTPYVDSAERLDRIYGVSVSNLPHPERTRASRFLRVSSLNHLTLLDKIWIRVDSVNEAQSSYIADDWHWICFYTIT